jgi:spoIIIJ-associated protein
MSSFSNKEIESRGVTVEAAVAAGLLRLGLRKDQVAVTVLDEGSRGLLGIGSREAIVRIAPLSVAPETPVAPPPTPRPMPAAPPPAAPAPKSVVEPPAIVKLPESRPRPVEAPVEADEGEAAPSSPYELAQERETAVSVIQELLDKMLVNASVSGYLTEPDDLTGQSVNIIDIGGEDLGVLIGPRGETLDSLQFVSRLMVSHKLHRRVNFVVDVEGFRRRREQALTRLAERMADKARQRGEPIALEPMSAYERRIIHMTLRGAPDVYTESTGEGKQRRVRIFPKR